jgi:hypothetical protein
VHKELFEAGLAEISAKAALKNRAGEISFPARTCDYFFFGFCAWRSTSPARLRVTLLFECIALPASLFTRFDSFAIHVLPKQNNLKMFHF